MKLAFVVDPLERLKPYKDSSVAMMREAARRGHEVHALGAASMTLREGSVRARTMKLALSDDDHAWYSAAAAEERVLASFDVVMMLVFGVVGYVLKKCNYPLAPLVLAIVLGDKAEEAFRQFLASTEKLRLYHNGEFGIYSEPNESRDSFLARCREEARRRVDDEAERLEGTFRRRLDQVRERSERDQREIDKDDTVPKNMSNEVNLAWGQRLYNITSGKPAAVAEASQSPREGDYLAKIAMIQKAWDRELEGIREDLESKANEIEEIVVAPAGKNIEITRYLILWGAGLL